MRYEDGIRYVQNDGGRFEAGFKGSTGDCGVRAAAIVLQLNYRTVYDELQEIQTRFNKTKRKVKPSWRYVRNGVWREVMHEYMIAAGAQWVSLASVGGEVVRVKDVAERWPASRVVMRLSRHFSAMVNGSNHDTWPQLADKRVYGVWVLPNNFRQNAK